MKSIDVKSMIIGALLTLSVVLGMAAVNGSSVGMYQVSFVRGAFMIMNTQTGKFACAEYDSQAQTWKFDKNLSGQIPDDLR